METRPCLMGSSGTQGAQAVVTDARPTRAVPSEPGCRHCQVRTRAAAGKSAVTIERKTVLSL